VVLTIEEKVFLVQHVLHNGDKYTENVQQKFAQQFPDAQVPHRNAVRNLINKFHETGSVQDAPQSGKPSTSEETVLNIQDRMLQSPSNSVRWLSQQVHVSKNTTHRILRKNLKLYPYRMSIVHQLKERDHQSCVDYCFWFQNFHVEEGEEILDVTFFTDEAWFHLSKYVISQNTRLWCSENPHEFKEMAVHDQKVRVWCAIRCMRIIGPIFFSDTINAELYSTDILKPFLCHLTEHEIEEAWFQQDGAAAHTQLPHNSSF
jgi:hypothetical protein